MLITFSCTAYENITMFGDIAKRLLTLMGHSATVPGAFSADEVPAALSRLKEGVGREKLKGQQPSQNQQDDEEEPISLANRALPLIQMLEAAAKAKKSVLWS